MKDEVKSRFLNWFTAIAIVVTIVGGSLMAYPNFRRGQELRRQEAELKRQIEEKKREIAKLTEYQRRFRNDPDFVEAIARQNRRVYPGELVFIFED